MLFIKDEIHIIDPFMYNQELDRLHVKFKFINALHISCYRKYRLYNYYKLGARFAFARQHYRVLLIPNSYARWVSRGVHVHLCFRYAQ